MRTKLSVWCEKVIEAGWLTALVVTPMVFNVYAQRPFELMKVSLIRSLALIMSVAWVIRAAEVHPDEPQQDHEGGWGHRVSTILSRPLVLPALIFAAVQILATVTSVWPHGSFWGSYDRVQGTYTTLSYLIIFFLVLPLLRTQEQLERLVGLTVFASLPVSLYAIIQHVQLLPGPWGLFTDDRAASSLGNPIFAAAYLIMVVPLAMRQLIRTLSELRAGRRKSASGVASASFYLLVLVAQLSAIVLTQSRGPFLGLLAGLFLFLLLWALLERRTRLALTVVGVAVLFGLLFTVLNLPNTPLSAVNEWPYVGRLGNLAADGTLQSRFLIWQGVVDMSLASPWRALVGYGPESMDVSYYRFMPSALVDMEGLYGATDRAHNKILETLATTGLIGVLAYLFVVGSLFYRGLDALDLAPRARERGLLAGLVVEGGLLGLLAPWLASGSLQFAGLGIAAGLLGGLVVYLVIFVTRHKEKRAKDHGNQLLLIALLSALVAHFIEGQTGIDVTATRTYFWVYAGLVAAVASPVAGQRKLACADNESIACDGSSGHADRRDRPRVLSILPHALLVGLLLITIAFGFVTHQFDLQDSWPIVGLFLLVWLFGGALGVVEAGAAPAVVGRPSRMRLLLVHLLCSGACLAAFLPIQAVGLRGFPAVAGVVSPYYLVFFFLLLSTATVLWANAPLPRRFWRLGNGWTYALLVALLVLLVHRTSLNPVKADVHVTVGRVYQSANRWDASIAAYQRAVDLQPQQARYYTFLGQAYLKKAQPRTPQRQAWFRKGEEALRRAVEINPRQPDYQGNLGNLYHAWADVTDSPAEKAERLMDALSYYQQAVRLAPQTYRRILREAMFDAHLALAESYARLERIDQAIRQAEAALDLAPAGQTAQIERLIAQLEAQGG